MSVEVKTRRIINSPIDSNSFILYREDKSNCIVIDPGTPGCDKLLLILNELKLKPEYIFLTHEHFDHIWGVNKLKDTFNSKIVCSKECAESIIQRKKNMSVFYDQKGFDTYPADILIEDLNYMLFQDGIKIEFIASQGHSNGSICILVGNNLFTGDTIIYNTKTVLKFPGGSKEKLKLSLEMIFSKLKDKVISVFPGHGNCFLLSEITFGNLM
jgi:glyoxylase-like metal-dependent hydrolase (beta-lactamase superfamily II)